MPTRALVLFLLLVGCGFAVQAGEDTRGPSTGDLVTNPHQKPALQADSALPSSLVPAQVNWQPSSQFGGSILDRSKLTGNWWGARDVLYENGMTLDVSATQFYQGVTSGGIDRTANFGGRNDYLFNIDGAKAGLWEGLQINLHGESRYGNDINYASGTLLVPPNIAMLFPLPSGTETGLTAVKATQYLTDNLVIYGGKFNMLDELVQTYGAGRGVDGFMNTGLVFPVVLDRTVPYSTLGAGFSVMNGKRALFTLMAFDTHNSPTTSGFESFFKNGVVVLSKLELPVQPLGLPGHQGVEVTYSTGAYDSLQTIPYLVSPAIASATSAPVQGSWSLFYCADQALYVDPNNPNRSWGVFTNIGVADNDPSPLNLSASFGLSGSSPVVSRPLDTFGIGYSFCRPSNGLIMLDPQNLPVRNDHALELYYNIAVTPWLRLTPDLQILWPGVTQTPLPAATSIDTAVLLGVRAKIIF